MTDRSEPTTAAGRALLDLLHPLHSMSHRQMTAGILAIEAEARQPDSEALRGHWKVGQPNQSYIDGERDRLIHAHSDNSCGDYQCMRRRMDAAIQVLTGWANGHADIALAVEMWQEEVEALPPSDPPALDVARLRTVLIHHGFAYQNWQNGDIGLPVKDVEEIAAEYASLSAQPEDDGA